MKFTIKKAEAQDAELFANVLQTVYGHMEHKEWFVIDEEPYFREIFASGKGIGYEAFEIKTGALSGVFAAYFWGNLIKI